MNKTERQKVINLIDELCTVNLIDSEPWIEKLTNSFSPPRDDKDPRIEELGRFFNDTIRPLRSKDGKLYMNPQSRLKIAARLLQFTLEELKQALTKFSHNSWRMANNSNKSLDWFFRTDAQVETFMSLEEDLEPANKGYLIGSKMYTLEQLTEAEKIGEIVYDERTKSFFPTK